MFSTYREATEGELTRARASLVNRRKLAEVSRSLDLSSHLVLGRGARVAGNHRLDSILSDAFEAILGAAYLDGGLEACTAIVDRWLKPGEVEPGAWSYDRDYKTRLQEETQSRFKITPVYSIVPGAPESPDFIAEVSVDGTVRGRGTGVSKAGAEQDAAKRALAWLAADSS